LRQVHAPLNSHRSQPSPLADPARRRPTNEVRSRHQHAAGPSTADADTDTSTVASEGTTGTVRLIHDPARRRPTNEVRSRHQHAAGPSTADADTDTSTVASEGTTGTVRLIHGQSNPALRQVHAPLNSHRSQPSPLADPARRRPTNEVRSRHQHAAGPSTRNHWDCTSSTHD
jgi:hypothetical protein